MITELINKLKDGIGLKIHRVELSDLNDDTFAVVQFKIVTLPMCNSIYRYEILQK